MSGQRYFSFLEKVTRKLAETFLELNELCIREIAFAENQNEKPQQLPPKQNQVAIEVPPENQIEVDSPQEEQLSIKSPKTKKIKKILPPEEEEKENESIKSKKKQKKVSHKPKAPASSFLLFFKDQQNNISAAYPNFGVTDLTKVAAKLWNELSASQKEPYIKLGDEERKQYQIKMQKYRLQFPQEIAEKEKDRLLKKQKKTGGNPSLKKQKQGTVGKSGGAQDNKDLSIQADLQKVIIEEQESSSQEGVDENGQDSLGMV